MNKSKRSKVVNLDNATSKSAPPSKLCRLCETKDGPFLNIFDTDMDLSSKIDSLLPITVTEYDDLPHKICFRCSAKLTDLYEFVNKCIETQQSLSKSLNRSVPTNRTKSTKSKKIWSERLTKNKISNNAYCEELIQQALESVGKGVLDLLKDADYKRASAMLTERKSSITTNLNAVLIAKNDKDAKGFKETKDDIKNAIDIDNQNTKQLVLKIPQTRNTASTPSSLTNEAVKLNKANEVNIEKVNLEKNKVESNTEELPRSTRNEKRNPMPQTILKQNTESKDLEINNDSTEDLDFEKDVRICISRVSSDDPSKRDECMVKNEKKVTTFKVAGVGTVFSCEKCKRIFLSEEKISNHVCVTDISKSVKESDSSDRRMSNVETKGSKKAFEKDIEKPVILKEKLSENSHKRKLPGPASKTLNVEKPNKNITKTSQPVASSEALTVDSIMKSLINNQMHYQLVPGPNNTLVLQASPQTINIPINLLGAQSLSSVPSPITPNASMATNTSVSDADYSGPKPDSNRKQIQPQQKCIQIPALTLEPPTPSGRSRRKTTQSQVSVATSDTPVINHNPSINEPCRIVNTQKPSSGQKNNTVCHVQNIASQFSSEPLNTPGEKGPFPVALTKNLYNSNSAAEEPSVDVDNYTGNLKRKSRDIPERAKRAKINPEVIDLEDDEIETTPALDDLLVERPKRGRGRPAGRKPTNKNKSDKTEPKEPPTYRVVPNNNPRKLIISAVASASDSKREAKKSTVSNMNNQSGNNSKASGRKNNNLFFAHLMDEDAPETLLPDKTVLQESQITTTVSARATKGRGAPSKESVGLQKCMMCNMAFSDNSKLSAHMKIHYASWI